MYLWLRDFKFSYPSAVPALISGLIIFLKGLFVMMILNYLRLIFLIIHFPPLKLECGHEP